MGFPCKTLHFLLNSTLFYVKFYHISKKNYNILRVLYKYLRLIDLFMHAMPSFHEILRYSI